MYEKKYVFIRRESGRLESVDKYIMSQQYLSDAEVKKSARSEINLFNSLATDEEGRCSFPEQKYYEYYQNICDIKFEGKVIIRPYRSLYECIMDGIKGFFDVSLVALSAMVDGDFLFAVKIHGKEDKAFAYVLFDKNGKIKRAMHPFNLEVEDSVILKYLNLFAKDILLPSIENRSKQEVHIA